MRTDGTDKSHDDHKYVDFYSSIFEPLRDSVVNMTEIGIAAGQSLQVWHDYFPNAHIYGIDISIYQSAVQTMGQLKRVTMKRGNSLDEGLGARLHFAPASMDIIIDDGQHTPFPQAKTLEGFWRYLRPGGYYIMEDVMTGANTRGNYNVANTKGRGGPLGVPGTTPLVHNRSWWPPLLRRIYEEHDAYIVDTLPGHRNFQEFKRQTNAKGTRWMEDEVNHNSHLLVIRKRTAPRTRRIKTFAKASYNKREVVPQRTEPA